MKLFPAQKVRKVRLSPSGFPSGFLLASGFPEFEEFFICELSRVSLWQK
jgi:hypothetical protein